MTKKLFTKQVVRALFLLYAAISATGIQAKNADELRIYLNPGHGSWGPNDRPVETIPYPNLSSTGRPDTCGFYESNTDLWKVLKIRETLVRAGVKPENIVMSRVKNGPYPYVRDAGDETMYNRSLSEICEEVDYGNFDMFLSVHSDASSTNVNKTLYLYRGKNGTDYVAGSKSMAQTVWPHACVDVNKIDYASSTYVQIQDDYTFYGSHTTRYGSKGTYSGYLGVLKHGVAGFLSEGYCHSYPPASHRALNRDYCRQEGVRLARGIIDYFGLPTETVGYIMGAVKDKSKSVNHSLYTYKSGTRAGDEYWPVMGAKVCLYSGNQLIDVYTTDNNYNGVFVFEDLQPGSYTIKVIASGYADYSQNVTVTANATTYPLIYITAGNGTDPSTIEDPLPAEVELYSSLELNNDGGNTYSDISGTIKKTAQYGDITVALTTDAKLYKIDNTTHAVSQISTAGLIQAASSNDAGFYSPLSSIAFTSDGVLVGINNVRCQSDASEVQSGYKRGTVYVYKWPTLDSDPVQWFSSESSASYSRGDVGDDLTVSGSSQKGVISAIVVNGYTTKSFRFLNFSIENGSLARTDYANNAITETASNFLQTTFGTKLSLQVSPNNTMHYYIDGELGRPMEFRMVNVYPYLNSNKKYYNAEILGRCSNNDVPNAANRNGYIMVNGHKLMIVPTTETSGSNMGIRLFDISNGVDKASLIATTNTTLSSKSATYTATHAIITDDNELVIYLVRDNSIVKFSTGVIIDEPDTPTPPITDTGVKGIFAYGLDLTDNNDETYTFIFTPNTTPKSGRLVFYDKNGNEVGSGVALNDLTSGKNKITVAKTELPGDLTTGDMTWAVELEGQPINTFTKLNTANSSIWSYTRACPVVDNSPESDYFGNIYAGVWEGRQNSANGLWAYNPDWTRINNSVYRNFYEYTGKSSGVKQYEAVNLINNFHIGIDYTGTVYFSEYGDATSGIYLVYPNYILSNKRSFNIFEGTHESSGLWKNGSIEIGSSTSAVSIGGTNVGTKMFMLVEDLTNHKNDIAVYDIVDNSSGAFSMTWDKAPSKILDVKNYGTSNDGQLHADNNGGVWLSHYRSDTSSDQKALIYVDKNGTVTFTSDAISSTFSSTRGGGFAVSPDNSRLAIGDKNGDICLYNISWNGTTPTLTFNSKFTDVDVKDNTTTSNASQQPNGIYQMSFDWGGNLIVGGRGIGIYALPTTNNKTITPAKKILTVSHEPCRVYTADNLRVCLDPGHDAFSANDRNMVTINHAAGDKTGFWESSANLVRANAARDALIRMGVKPENIIMTRTTNDTYTSLGQRRDITESNDVDVFISFHSNAAGYYDSNGEYQSETLSNGALGNYPLFLYRGTDEKDKVHGSKALSEAIWQRHWMPTNIDPTSHPEITLNNPFIKGDITYYDPTINTGAGKGPEWGYNATSQTTNYGYLGVLRHNVPGLLIESFCHNYQPTAQRALNNDYNGMVGIKIARGIMDYFGLEGETTGYILGTVKDKNQSLTNSLYKYMEGSVDAYLPINGATVKLYRKNELIDTYTTDNEYNGVFVFSNLQPGDYKIVTSFGDYDDDTQYVTVQANETAYSLVYLDKDLSTPKGIYAYGLTSSQNEYGDYDFTFTSNARSHGAAIIFYDAASGTQVGNPIKIDDIDEGESTTVTLSQDEIPGAAGQRLTWAVSLTGKEVSEMSLLKTIDVDNTVRLSPTIDNSPESDYFGRIYVSSFYEYSNANNGLLVYNQDLTAVNTNVYRGGNTYANNYRITTDKNGKIYLADWGDATSGVYVADPSNLNGTFSQFFTGTRTTSGNYSGLIGSSTAGSTATVNIADGKMYTSIEDISAHVRDVAIYDITNADGSIATLWGSTPRFVSTNDKVTVSNGDYNIVGDDNGGLWVAQKTTANTSSAPALLYYNSSGTLVYNSATESHINGSLNGAIAVNHDNTLLAIHDANTTIQVFDITWNSGVPTLSFKTSLNSGIASTVSGSSSYKNTKDAVYQMAFDWGDNLLAGGEKLGYYSIPLGNNTHITPAKSSMLVIKEQAAEITLAQLVESGLAGNNYTITNPLTCVYIDNSSTILYCKDNNEAVDKTENDGRIDYMQHHKLMNGDADQSNWVAIVLPAPLSTNNIENYIGHQLIGVTGRYTNRLNPTLVIDELPITSVENPYTPNVYIPCSFVEENWTHDKFYFVKPKANEYAIITWAIYDSETHAFYIPSNDGKNNSDGLNGGFEADFSMLPEGSNPTEFFNDGIPYRFKAIINKKGDSQDFAPRNPRLKSNDTADANKTILSSEFVIYPLEMNSDGIITGINGEIAVPTLVDTRYYNSLGVELPEAPSAGFFIEVQTYSDGSHVSIKKNR